MDKKRLGTCLTEDTLKESKHVPHGASALSERTGIKKMDKERLGEVTASPLTDKGLSEKGGVSELARRTGSQVFPMNILD